MNKKIENLQRSVDSQELNGLAHMLNSQETLKSERELNSALNLVLTSLSKLSVDDLERLEVDVAAEKRKREKSVQVEDDSLLHHIIRTMHDDPRADDVLSTAPSQQD